MRAGSLNKTINIERLFTIIGLTPGDGLVPSAGLVPLSSDIQDKYGDDNSIYNFLFKTRCSIKPITGKETFLQGLKNTVSHKIELRDRKDIKITPEDRIEYQGRYFDIQYILNWGEMNIGLTLLCVESLYKD